ncbi:MAG: hypothetical protein JSW27_18890 [Phycisphaerales bacterium]|nr:MAG: hypothetical protein JSW27_18890 [Phycisphaerales bacterium]
MSEIHEVPSTPMNGLAEHVIPRPIRFRPVQAEVAWTRQTHDGFVHGRLLLRQEGAVL